MLDDLKALGIEESDNWGAMLYQVFQRGIKTEKDRIDLKAAMDYILTNGPKLMKKDKTDKIMNVVFIIVFILTAIGCGYVAWKITYTPKKTKKAKLPPKSLRAKKE